MQKFIEKYMESWYYIFVLIISGVLLIPQYFFNKAGDYLVSFPQLAPTLSVIGLCIITQNKNIWKSVKKSFSLSVKNMKWIPIILAIAISAVSLTACILSLIGFPFQPWEGSIKFYIINSVVIVFGCMFEEIGWRGFLLPTLGKKYSPIVSTLIVGALWGFWHMSFNLGLWGFLIFIVSAMELSILMTWVYYKTEGNLLLMTFWHVSINILNQFLLKGRLTAEGFTVLVAVFAVICFCVITFNKKLFMEKAEPIKMYDAY